MRNDDDSNLLFARLSQPVDDFKRAVRFVSGIGNWPLLLNPSLLKNSSVVIIFILS